MRPPYPTLLELFCGEGLSQLLMLFPFAPDNAVDNCFTTQVIDGDGTFNATGLERFMSTTKFNQCGLSYFVVSIIGPQSSGKSTLLNELFGTNFVEMDAYKGRSQTTLGVWAAKAVRMEPFTVVLDFEGSDGRERGEDDTAFEKQIALFALVASDILLINMWCCDLGREHGANKPLLRIILEVYVTKLCRPGKTTLMFVIRDKTQTPVALLRRTLLEDIQKIWDTVPKPKEHQHARLSDFFIVEVVALSNRQYEKEQFEKDVRSLKGRLSLIYAQNGRSAVPAAGFSFSCQTYWEDIKKNKDLDLLAHKILVANKRCGDIADEVYSYFEESKTWQQVNEMVESGSYFSGFGRKLSALIGTSMCRYDLSEAAHFDKQVRLAKREQLSKQLFQLAEPVFDKALRSIKREAFEEFREALQKTVNGGTNIDSAAKSCTQSFMTKFNNKLADAGIELPDLEIALREELQSDIDAHIRAFRQGLPAPQVDAASQLANLGIRDTPRYGVRDYKQLESKKRSILSRIAWRAFCLGVSQIIGIDFSAFSS